MDNEEIIKRLDEDLYNDERDDIDLEGNMKGPDLLASEVEEAVENMKDGKAPRPDDISEEELKALGDLGVEIITKMLNDIYDTDCIPDDLLKSMFIAVLNKPGTTDHNVHKATSQRYCCE